MNLDLPTVHRRHDIVDSASRLEASEGTEELEASSSLSEKGLLLHAFVGSSRHGLKRSVSGDVASIGPKLASKVGGDLWDTWIGGTGKNRVLLGVDRTSMCLTSTQRLKFSFLHSQKVWVHLDIGGVIC